jgi:hypothetical protein
MAFHTRSSRILVRWPQFAFDPAQRLGFQRVSAHLHLVDATAACAAECPVLKARAGRRNTLDLQWRLAYQAAAPRDSALRQYRFWKLGHNAPPLWAESAPLSVTDSSQGVGAVMPEHCALWGAPAS